MSDAAPMPGTPASEVRYWIAELDQGAKAQESWLGRARKITKRYREEDAAVTRRNPARRYALLYSNIQTIQPAIYARPPQPVVSRRFKDSDPVGRLASEVLERALAYSVDKQDFDGALKSCTQDYVLIARGQAWERYVPTHGEAVTPQISVTPSAGGGYEDEEGNAYEEAKAGDDGAFTAPGEPYQPVVYEESVTDYVNWEDFTHSVARTWDEVWWVCRRAYMDRGALKKRFGDKIGAAIPLDWGDKSGEASKDELTCKAAIYEVWDKRTKKVRWISKGYGDAPLDVRADPLKLDGFFPCPKPLLGTTANDNLYPTPDYVYYQDQAEEIDDLTQRIAELQDALKVKGFYAGEEKTNLDNLLKAKNTTLIPIPSWQTMKENGGLRGLIEWWPIEQVVVALKACIENRSQLIEDVFQITGVADIMRGASDPRETYGAQALRAQWGSVRVRDRQKEVARFARDIVRIKAEVIAETFSIDTLKAMTGIQIPTAAEKAQAQQQVQAMQQRAAMAAQQQMPGQPGAPPPAAQMGHNGGPPMDVPPELQEVLSSPTWEDVQKLLKDNALRQFRIDVETDSTIEPNETEEKQQTVELMTALGSFIAQWGPVVQAQPAMAPVVAELLKFALRRYRVGRELEDVVERAMAQVGSAPPQQQQEPEKPAGKSPQELTIEAQSVANDRERNQQDFALGQQELALKQGDQQIKLRDQDLKMAIASRDPQPQATA
jgi:hypothetical protein